MMPSSTTTAAILRHRIREMAASSAASVSASASATPATYLRFAPPLRVPVVAGARGRRRLSSAAANDLHHQQQHHHHPLIASRRSLERLRGSGVGSGVSGNAKAGSDGAGKQQGQQTKSEWPRSVRIGGYAAASMLVPYVLCSMVAELPRLRRLLEGDRPHDPDDRRLGKAAVDFVRKYWGVGEPPSLPGEDGADVRRTQAEIARDLDRPVGVEVSVAGDGVRRAVGRVDGDVLLSSEVEILRGVGLDGDGYCSGPILVDFVELEEEQGGKRGGAEENVGGGADWTSTTTFSTGNDFASSLPPPEDGDDAAARDEEADAARRMRQLTHTYSAWHHFPPAAAAAATDATVGGANDSKATPGELKISELEWREAGLQQQLIDPNCTRDIDDMRTELAEVRGELRRLKGWRWKPW